VSAAWILAALLPLSALAPAAESPAAAAQRQVDAVFVKVGDLLSRQAGADARAAAQLDGQIESLAPAVLRWKWRAVAPLANILFDSGRPLKARLFALSFMGLTHDPLALPHLKGVLLDPRQPPTLRSAAASALPLLRISRQSARQPLCDALKDESLPQDLARSILAETARLGCDDARLLEHRLHGFGIRPQGREQDAAFFAIATLGRSRPIEAARVLMRLLEVYPRGSPEKPAILKALWIKRRDLPAFRNDASSALIVLLRSESDCPAAIVAAIPLLASLRNPRDVPLLRRFLDNPDAEVATVAAEALADLQVLPAREDIVRILARVHQDPRFAPAAGRPDPKALIGRLEKAEKKLR